MALKRPSGTSSWSLATILGDLKNEVVVVGGLVPNLISGLRQSRKRMRPERR